MPGSTKRKSFRIFLTTFKWCRIALWLVILAMVSAILYLHVVGLPDYVKVRLLAELRARGIDAEFYQMRLGWSHEILAQDVAFGRANDPLSPSLSAGLVEVRVNFMALLRRQLRIDSFCIEQGKLRLPAGGPDKQSLSMEDVGLRLRFLPGDCVQLENARGTLHGVAIYAEGVLTNFSAMRGWSLPTLASGSPVAAQETNADWRAGLRQAIAVADKVQFSKPPELHVTISGDARDPNSLKSGLSLVAPSAQTPWGELTNFSFKANCSRVIDPGANPFALVQISADKVRTTWGGASQISLRMTLSRIADPAFMHGTVELSASRLHAKWDNSPDSWARMSRLEWTGEVDFNPTNLTIKTAQGTLFARHTESAFGSIRQAAISFQCATNSSPSLTNSSWGPWSFAEPYNLDWQIDSSGIKMPAVEIQSLNFAGRWRGPELAIQKLDAKVLDTQVKADARLDISTRRFDATLSADVNLLALEAQLSPAIQKRMADFVCQDPPKLAVNVSLVLPPWAHRETGDAPCGADLRSAGSRSLRLRERHSTLEQPCLGPIAKPGTLLVGQTSGLPVSGASGSVNTPCRATDWKTAILRSLSASATLSIGQCAYQNISVDSVQSSMSYSNGAVEVSRFLARRPDGEALLSGTASGETGEFLFTIDSQLDPNGIIKELVDLGDNESWLNETQLAHPPKVHAEGRGNWHDMAALSAKGSIEVTNFVVLGQPIGSFTASLDYSNNLLNASNVMIIQGDQFITVPLLKYDFNHQIMTFVNGVATFDPRRVFRALDSVLPEFLREIGFDAAPTVRVNGWFSMDDPEAVDLVFNVAGERFRWTNEINLRVDRISGDVDWKGREVNLTNVQASLYGNGVAAGWSYFDWRKLDGTLITFETTLTNIDLNTLVRGLSGEDRQLEGKLDGSVVVNGNSRYSTTWHGDGQLALHDAKLWDIPIFGIIISPLLNSLGDGLGNNRARDAAGTFVLTNGVLRTDDMLIHASKGLTLLYRGDVNLTEVNARVEARILREVPGIGKLISTILIPLTKTLEWRVTGPLRDPMAKPAYAPGFILDKTLHPIRTLKTLIPGSTSQSPDPTDISPFQQNPNQ